MKRYDIATRVLVDFEPGIGAKPAFFICASGTRAKVDRIIKKDEARWGFRSFTRYFLELGGRFAELYWDRTRDKWILVKEGRM